LLLPHLSFPSSACGVPGSKRRGRISFLFFVLKVRSGMERQWGNSTEYRPDLNLELKKAGTTKTDSGFPDFQLRTALNR
jgi:hypothetical protein